MSRRRRAISKERYPDSRFNSQLVHRLISSVMGQGKKTIAERIVYGAFDKVVEKTANPNPLEVFQKAIDNVRPRVEVRSRRVGGATYQVPVEVPMDRQITMAIRWIVDAAGGRKGVGMKDSLASEILEAYQGQGNSVRKREETHKMAQANKAFAHFRW
jgi:small subunit ribosomal protein S7